MTIDNGADWRKPNTFGEAALRSLEEVLGRLGTTGLERPARHRQAARVRRGRGHRPVPRDHTRARPRGRGGRARALRPPARAAVPDARRGQRRGARRRSRARAPLRRADDGVERPPRRLPGGLPRAVPRAGAGRSSCRALVGASAAVKLIVDNPLRQNRLSRASDALELGLVDHVLEPVEFVDESLELLLQRIEAGEGKREPAADLVGRGRGRAQGALARRRRRPRAGAGAVSRARADRGRGHLDARAGLRGGGRGARRAAARPGGAGVDLRVRRRRASDQASGRRARRAAPPDPAGRDRRRRD